MPVDVEIVELPDGTSICTVFKGTGKLVVLDKHKRLKVKRLPDITPVLNLLKDIRQAQGQVSIDK
jgi:hypothetical protein